MKRLFTVLLLSICLVLTAKTNNTKSIYIYQFTRLIEWPTDFKSGMFRIGVLGSFDTYKHITEVTLGRNVGNQNIEVMNVVNIKLVGLTNYHILVIGEDYCTPEQLKAIKLYLKDKPTLLVTTKTNFRYPGICVGFESTANEYSYFYRLNCIESRNLKCSREFLTWGKRDD